VKVVAAVAAAKKKRGGGGGTIEGLTEALTEAFNAAEVDKEEADMADVMKKVESAAYKQSTKFYSDERSNSKMTHAQARAYVEEFVEAVMGSLSNFLYEKSWFEKVGWHGTLLMIVMHTFGSGKVFTRVLKTDIMPFIESGLMSWSEEERITRAIWDSLEAGGIAEGNHKKKANQHLTKAYDEAHFNAPFGESDVSSLGPDVANLQDFVKGWMSVFAGKAYNVLENGLPDTGKAAQVTALTAIFQSLLDPACAACPLQLQPALPAAPWAFIETCATEVISEHEMGSN